MNDVQFDSSSSCRGVALTTATAGTTPVTERCFSAGRPLTAVARSETERRLGRQYRELTGHTAWLHEDDAAASLCARLGVGACATGQRIYLGDAVRALERPARTQVIVHGMVHLMQIARGAVGRPADTVEALEREAESFAARTAPDLLDVRARADPRGVYGLW